MYEMDYTVWCLQQHHWMRVVFGRVSWHSFCGCLSREVMIVGRWSSQVLRWYLQSHVCLFIGQGWVGSIFKTCIGIETTAM